jgi:hypothetical protein
LNKIAELPTLENLVVLVDYDRELVVVDQPDSENPKRIAYGYRHELIPESGRYVLSVPRRFNKPQKWINLDGRPYRPGDNSWTALATFDDGSHQTIVHAFGEPQPGLLPDNFHEMMLSVYEYNKFQ